MKPVQGKTPFQVGSWRVYPLERKLCLPGRPGEDKRVTPLMMRLLLHFAAHAGVVCTREQLRQHLWPDVVVEEDSLTHAISDLRKALGDAPSRPRYIETIPKAGYRLIAPVEALPAVHAARPARWRAFLSYVGAGVAGLLLMAWLAGRPAPEAVEPVSYTETPLTSFPGLESSPALSPDGHRLAFVRRLNDGRNALFLKVVGESHALRLTEGPADAFNPAWSPDGTQIAYVATTEDDCGLYTMSAVGGPATRLTTCAAGTAPSLAWSPDASVIVYSDRERPGEPLRLFALSLADGRVRALTSPPPGIDGDRFPAFSSDGREIAFARRKKWGLDAIYTSPAAGGATALVREGSWAITGLVWGSRSDKIVFTSNIDGGSHIAHLSPHGGPVVRMAALRGLGLSPSLSRDEHRLAISVLEHDVNIWRGTLSGGAVRLEAAPLLASTYWDASPQYSPDGRRVVFVSSRTGHHELWIGDTDGGALSRITDFNGPYLDTPRWSPDGSRIVFEARSDGESSLYLATPQGSRVRRLTPAGANQLAASWSADGRSLLYASDESGAWQLWRLTPADGTSSQVTRDGGFAGFEAEDGATLYYVRSNAPGLWRLGPGDPSPRPILPDFPASRWGDWVLRGQRIYYYTQTACDGPSLARYHLRDETTECLLGLSGGDPYGNPGFALSPDEETILLSRLDRSDSDIMLLEFQ